MRAGKRRKVSISVREDLWDRMIDLSSKAGLSLSAMVSSAVADWSDSLSPRTIERIQSLQAQAEAQAEEMRRLRKENAHLNRQAQADVRIGERGMGQDRYFSLPEYLADAARQALVREAEVQERLSAEAKRAGNRRISSEHLARAGILYSQAEAFGKIVEEYGKARAKHPGA